MSEARESALAAADTVQAWARAFVATTSLEEKLAPPPRPAEWAEPERSGPPLAAPGRDPRLTVSRRAQRSPTPGGLARAAERARLLHTFMHHEVQAAELMANAVLAYPAAPRRFHRGLLAILDDELRHARAYGARLAELGAAYGDYPVRDWFWERVPACRDAVAFVALMGMGLEGGNLEHTRRFELALAAAGDAASAELVARIGEEEVPHVRFATRWFARWTSGDAGAEPDFEAWRRKLPPPLTPTVLRGRPLARERRARAGQGARFQRELEAWDGPAATLDAGDGASGDGGS